MNRNRKNTLAMFVGSENQEPCVVYVRGTNKMGWLVLEKVNKSESFFDDAELDTLLDFDFKQFEILKAKWNVESAKRSVVRREEQLKELLEQSQ
jgi:hypothetical protein